MGSHGALMNNVISLTDRLENWNLVFESLDAKLRIFVSTHGRTRVETKNITTTLDLVQGADLITSLQKGFDSLCNISHQQKEEGIW